MPSDILVYFKLGKRKTMRIIMTLLVLSSSTYATPIALPKNFTADFTQKITNTNKKTINYSGKVRFSNALLLKWDYKKPTKKEVCTNRQELTVVDHDLEQVSRYVINKGFNFSKILKKAKLHRKNIYVAKYENKSYTIQVDSKQRLHSIAYYDDLDNKVQIVFRNVKYSKKNLSHKSMTCTVPHDYDVIKG